MTKKYLGKFLILATSCLALNLNANDGSAAAVHYPLRNLDRPSVMPVGMINVDTNVVFEKSGTAETDKPANRALGLNFDAQFGIVKRVQGTLSYNGFTYKFGEKFDSKVVGHKLTLGAKYNYVSIPHFSTSLIVKLPFNIMEDGEIVRNITVGLPIIGYNNHMAGGIFDDLIELTVRPKADALATFNFKAWYGYQFGNHVWAQLKTSFGKVQLPYKDNKAEKKMVGFWQELPLTLGIVYSFNNAMDLGADFGVANAIKGFETINAGLTFSFRAGKFI